MFLTSFSPPFDYDCLCRLSKKTEAPCSCSCLGHRHNKTCLSFSFDSLSFILYPCTCSLSREDPAAAVIEDCLRVQSEWEADSIWPKNKRTKHDKEMGRRRKWCPFQDRDIPSLLSTEVSGGRKRFFSYWRSVSWSQVFRQIVLLLWLLPSLGIPSLLPQCLKLQMRLPREKKEDEYKEWWGSRTQNKHREREDQNIEDGE